MAPSLTATKDTPFEDVVIHGHAVINGKWHFYLFEQDETIMKGFCAWDPHSFTADQCGTICIKELSDPDVWGLEVKWEENWEPTPVRKVLLA